MILALALLRDSEQNCNTGLFASLIWAFLLTDSIEQPIQLTLSCFFATTKSLIFLAFKYMEWAIKTILGVNFSLCKFKLFHLECFENKSNFSCCTITVCTEGVDWLDHPLNSTSVWPCYNMSHVVSWRMANTIQWSYVCISTRTVCITPVIPSVLLAIQKVIFCDCNQTWTYYFR